VVQNLRVNVFYFIKILVQIINNFSKVQQNEKELNLCQNGKGTTIFKCSWNGHINQVK
jgi:hypothetical protein